MGSSYFGERSLGNGRSGSSRKGKKSHSDKPKKPQRGLGVAQLEKIRLRSQMDCSFPHSPHTPYQTNLNQTADASMQITYSSVPTSPSLSYSSSSTSSYGYHANIMIGLGEMESADTRYANSQFGNKARWNYNNVLLAAQHPEQTNESSNVTRLHMEDSQPKKTGLIQWIQRIRTPNQAAYKN